MTPPEAAAVELTEQEEVEALMGPEGGAAIVDFWSPTCGPCLAMAPAFEAVAAEHQGGATVRFLKINTAEHPELAQPFRIRAVPTILFVLNGEIVDVCVGALGAADLDKKARWLQAKARGDGFFTGLFSRR